MITIKIEGMEQLQRKLGQVVAPAAGIVQELAKFVQTEGRQLAKPHPADTGAIAELIKTRLAPGGVPLWAKVKAGHPLSMAVELGTAAGRRPRWRPIARWAERHGASPGAVVQAIRASGTRGVFYMKRAAEAAQKEVPRLLREVAKQVEAAWRR